MAEDRDLHPDADRAATAALAPFFAAGRAAAPEPSVALLSAILADAVSATAARAAAPAPAPAGRRWAPAIGGWRGATALAACALLGFWLGIAGELGAEGRTLGAAGVWAEDGTGDPADALFDLASAE